MISSTLESNTPTNRKKFRKIVIDATEDVNPLPTRVVNAPGSSVVPEQPLKSFLKEKPMSTVTGPVVLDNYREPIPTRVVNAPGSSVAPEQPLKSYLKE